MSFETAVATLLVIKERLPAGDPRTPRARALLEELEASADRERRRALVDELLALLLEVDEVQELLSAALWELARPAPGSLADARLESLPACAAPGAFGEPAPASAGRRSPFRLRLPSLGRRLKRESAGERRSLPEAAPVRAGGGAHRTSAAEMIERTPHLEIEGPTPLAPGDTATVTVYVDEQEFRDGEYGAKLALPALDQLVIEVTLAVSGHFAIRGSSHARIEIRDGESRSSSAVFEIECLGEGEGNPGVAASFVYRWRPVGSVSRDVEIEGAGGGADAGAPPPGGAVALDPEALPPDMLVEILRSPDGDERHYDLRVSTRHLARYRDGILVSWHLPTGTRDLVKGYMGAFTTPDRGGRKAALIGAGKELFRCTPKEFQEAFWELADSGQLQTMFIVTAEPFIPWELMIPTDGKRVGAPLGVQYTLGRWVEPEHVSPRQALAILDSYVIAPKYRADRRLHFAPAEAALVLDIFKGELIDPAYMRTIDAKLAERGATLLHLICHGSDEQSGQVLDLEPDERLFEVQLEGLEGVVRAVGEARPFVFINACQVGRPAPALVGTGGFAARFTRLGASGVIAPIWSVKDEMAEQVARLFYERARAEPTTPFAQILRDIRALAYEGEDPEDSYAAYCFYGDPVAAQSIEKVGERQP